MTGGGRSSDRVSCSAAGTSGSPVEDLQGRLSRPAGDYGISLMGAMPATQTHTLRGTTLHFWRCPGGTPSYERALGMSALRPRVK